MLMSSGTVGIAPSIPESLRGSVPKQCWRLQYRTLNLASIPSFLHLFSLSLPALPGARYALRRILGHAYRTVWHCVILCDIASTETFKCWLRVSVRSERLGKSRKYGVIDSGCWPQKTANEGVCHHPINYCINYFHFICTMLHGLLCDI